MDVAFLFVCSVPRHVYKMNSEFINIFVAFQFGFVVVLFHSNTNTSAWLWQTITTEKKKWNELNWDWFVVCEVCTGSVGHRMLMPFITVYFSLVYIQQLMRLFHSYACDLRCWTRWDDVCSTLKVTHTSICWNYLQNRIDNIPLNHIRSLFCHTFIPFLRSVSFLWWLQPEDIRFFRKTTLFVVKKR